VKPTTQEANSLLKTAIGLHRSGQIDQAVLLYRTLAGRYPAHAGVLYLLGTAESQRGNFEEGLRLLDRSLRAEPGNPEAHNNRGLALAELRRFDEAVQSFSQAIRLDPRNVGAHVGLAEALQSLSRYDEAVGCCRQALEFAPTNSRLHYLLGLNLHLQGLYLEAVAGYDHAVRLRPDFAEAQWNRAQLKLLLGAFAEGWRLHEWRWKAGASKQYARDFPHPLWLGEPSIAGRTLLVHAEAGIGDTIQFCRYLPMVEATGARIVFEVQSALASLVSSLPCRFTLVHGGQEIPPFDLHCPLMSLPLAFRTEMATIPAAVPYLHADDARRQQWRDRLGEKRGPRVGLVWAGNPEHGNDRNRSVALQTLACLFDLPVEFHSLQREYRDGDEAWLGRQAPLLRDHRHELNDFADTAALVAELDLVISVDTSVAHLAGALGRPVWILLPFVPDWRWLLERTDSPWYPSATLFRQPRLDDWDSVVGKVRDELARLAGSGARA